MPGVLDNFPDESGNEEEFEGEEEDTAEIVINIPEERLGKGFGFFDADVAKLKDGVDLENKKFYKTSPRPDDDSALSVPANHPLRAIAKVLDEAPEKSIIRVLAHSLTDKYAIDLLLHHCVQFELRVILDCADPGRTDTAFRTF